MAEKSPTSSMLKLYHASTGGLYFRADGSVHALFLPLCRRPRTGNDLGHPETANVYARRRKGVRAWPITRKRTKRPQRSRECILPYILYSPPPSSLGPTSTDTSIERECNQPV